MFNGKKTSSNSRCSIAMLVFGKYMMVPSCLLSDPPVCISELANKKLYVGGFKTCSFLLAQNDENHQIKLGHFEFPRHQLSYSQIIRFGCSFNHLRNA